jgi:hypothetical protein
MNPEYQKQLEAGVRRELESLGELTAPPALANRILRAIEARQAVPWYQRSWATWSLPWRLASLAALSLVFAGLCFAGWEITHGVTGARIWTESLADVAALWRTLGVLGGTAVTLLGRLGTGVITFGLVMIFLTWAACIALGTAYVRLALQWSVKRIEK